LPISINKVCSQNHIINSLNRCPRSVVSETLYPSFTKVSLNYSPKLAYIPKISLAIVVREGITNLGSTNIKVPSTNPKDNSSTMIILGISLRAFSM
ncbi:hypothetical protein Csa_012634, partial [Cucumis sativus]